MNRQILGAVIVSFGLYLAWTQTDIGEWLNHAATPRHVTQR